MKPLARCPVLLLVSVLAGWMESPAAQSVACEGFSCVPGPDPAGDLELQASTCLVFSEEDLEAYPPGASIPALASGAIDVNLVDDLGNLLADDASVFRSAAFDVPGVMFQNSLVNIGATNGAVGRIEFVFAPPVESFGAFAFDDWGSDDALTIEVLEVDGSVHVEGPKNLSAGTGIEGFLGFRSCRGIQRVRIKIASSFLELDHIQVGGPIPAAQAIVRNGSGVNRTCYSSARPVLGSSWSAAVDTSGHPGARKSIILGYAAPASAASPWGEILVDASSTLLFRSHVDSNGGLDVHSCGVPLDVCLAGLVVHSQAAIVGGGVELCNAIDLTIGW